MAENSVSIQRVREQLEALEAQEHDALSFLIRGCNLHLHDQIVRLISRIRADKQRLRKALRKALAEGKEHVRWRDLQMTGGLNENNVDRKGFQAKVIEFSSPRK